MLSIFSCACWLSVCLLWRNIYLGLLGLKQIIFDLYLHLSSFMQKIFPDDISYLLYLKSNGGNICTKTSTAEYSLWFLDSSFLLYMFPEGDTLKYVLESLEIILLYIFILSIWYTIRYICFSYFYRALFFNLF